MSVNRMFVIGTAVALVAILALGWLFGIAPQLQLAEAAKSERAAVAADNLTQESALIMLRERSANLATLAADVTQLRREIPATSDVETFLDALGDYAARSGVTLTTVSASEAVAYAGAVDPAAAPAAEATPAAEVTDGSQVAPAPVDGAEVAPAPVDGAGIYTVAISMTIGGSVEGIMDFTRAVQEGRRTFLATSVDFAAADDEAASTAQGEPDPGAGEETAPAVEGETAAAAQTDPGAASAPVSSGNIIGYLFVVRSA